MLQTFTCGCVQRMICKRARKLCKRLQSVDKRLLWTSWGRTGRFHIMEVGGPGFDAGVLVVNKGREILRVLT